MISFRRGVQLICLALFVGLLLQAGLPLPGWAPVGGFFRLDPLLQIGTLLSLGIVFEGLLVLLFLLVATLLLGRFFCGYVCPLGSSFDLVRCLGKASKRSLRTSTARFKYLVLAAIILAALYGLNLTHWGSPLSLAGRLYLVVLKPGLEFLLSPVAPLAGAAGLDSLGDWLGGSLQTSRFSGIGPLLLLFVLLFALDHVYPRFWCRVLCPSGAVFALAGRRPLLRRKVSPACTECGLCLRRCPMGAIASDPSRTDHAACIVCQQCVRLCPEEAISFGLPETASSTGEALPGRRSLLLAAGGGIGIAFLGRRSLGEFWGEEAKGTLMRQGLIRPPGSRPEEAFLNRCLRCGLCLEACPTNMLQPALAAAGFSGVFSPVAVAGRGPCEAECNVCGRVCPSGAIRSLPLEEKMWAKMGTAVITPGKCLAWEFDRSCLICDEACPYGAIELQQSPEHEVAVPVVLENRCTGCGSCEYACPVRAVPAIVITPMAELRLATGSYRREGRQRGLAISRTHSQEEGKTQEMQNGEEKSGLPPGFSE